MATGIASGAWGYSPQWVAGMDSAMEIDGYPLNYNLGLTSVSPPTFNGAEYISPLQLLNNFGARKCSIPLKMCKLFLKNKKINPMTDRPIKRNGPKYKDFMKYCKKYNLV
jgi:hypothetical protein